MRAIRYLRWGDPAEVLEQVEIPIPEPGPGEVLVRIAASGVNPHDVKKRSGWLGAPPSGHGVIPHSDGAGTVTAVGPGIDPARVGERVFFGGANPARGTAAEFCSVNAAHAFPLPDALTNEQGASLGVPAFTAWLCVLANGTVAGDTILVHGGSGAVGRVIVEMAVWNGAKVIATAGSDDRAAIAAAKGADHVLNYRHDDLAARVLDLTDGRGVDRIVDVDFAANMETNHRVIKDYGLICSYSSTSNREPVLPYYGFALKGVTLAFIQASKMQQAKRAAAGKTICALLERGRIIPDVSDVFAFADCAAAHTRVEAGTAGGNVVIVPSLGQIDTKSL
jgi:NADPH2:quinone reductase